MLILLCVFTSLFSWFVNPEVAYRFLVFKPIFFLRGMFWTPITALFVHTNFIHLIGNMFFLFVFGNTLEEELDSRKVVTAFFIGGFFSFVFSIPFYGLNSVMVGASAAIFTLAAAVMLIKPLKFSLLFLMPLGLVSILYFVYNLLALYFGVQGNVGYIAHVLGFIAGLPFGIGWSQGRWVKNFLITLLLLMIFMILVYTIFALF